MSEKGEIIEDVYYTMEKYSYLMADIDLSMSMRWERSAAYIAGALEAQILEAIGIDYIDERELSKETVSFCNDAVSYLEDFIPVL